MRFNWNNLAGLGLMVSAVLLLAILDRLDLLLIVAPLSVLFSYRLARANFRSGSSSVKL